MRGFLLLPVALALALVAVLALLLSREATLGAQRVGGESEAEQAIYVAEAGLAHASWVANQSMCTGYALPATPFQGATYSAVFTPNAGSPVSVAATGTLPSGVARTLTRSDVRVYENQATLTLQPDAAAGADAYLKDGAGAGTNYGASTQLLVTNKANQMHGLVRFDVSSIPPTARVDSATLVLNLESIGSGNAGTVDVRRVTASWDEAGVSWNQASTGVAWAVAGGDADPTVVATAAIDALSPGPTPWDVTALVAAWVSGEYANDGVLLQASLNINNAAFTSSDGADPALRPKLLVTYTCECGANGDTLDTQPDGAAGRDTYLDQWFAGRNYGSDNLIWVQGNGSSPYHGLLAFDLSSIPAAATVTAATLALYQAGASASGGPVEVHAVTRPWVEGSQSGANGVANWNEADAGVPWTTPGGDYDAAVAATSTLPSGTKGKFQWDVTTLAAEWVAGTRANDGLALIPGDPGTGAYFASSDDATAANRPRLTVTYSCPCGVICTPPAPGPSATLNPTADNTLYADATTTNHGADTDVRVGTGNPGAGPSRHALLRFDLSTIPTGATVTSARLRLNASSRKGSAAFDLEVHRVDQDWLEMNSNWDDAQPATPWTAGGGGTYAATVVATLPAAGTGWYEWEIGPLVQEWLDGVSANYGVELIHTPVAKRNRVLFDSRESVNPPELVVDYTAP